MATGRATLADVARAAGVGLATVSRALNGRPDVSEETTERVRRAAAALGYRPSGTARALRRGSFAALSAVVHDQVWGWWEPVLRAAASATAEAGMHLFVHPVTSGGDATDVIAGLANVPTEGVIVMGVPHQEALREECTRIGLPVVALDDSAHTLHLPTISARNRAGARRMTEYLIQQGHRRIVFVGGSTDEFVPSWGEGLFVEERLAGYREALAAAGIPFRDELVTGWADPEDESTALVGQLEELLRSGVTPDAVFCIADLVAPAVLRTLSAHRLSVPADVAVAGFDDERAALIVDPPLTTMRQPYEEMGRLAVELLQREIRGEALPVRRFELDAELVERESTRRAANSRV
ncbi:LacI family DNA-binding transcriptional regulator [Microbacterium sp.]|uniref:LacI family DNA-binding transcriptional regulator n=1 Tax=Microbacterium sp. TaxID=51671 RepID=UPI002810E03A|nr:LacI family DNA-binding transcriptional regulator [Microbacterium sp.]